MGKFQLYGLAAVALFALSATALAQGDMTKGKAAFAKCGICHQVGPAPRPSSDRSLTASWDAKPQAWPITLCIPPE